MFIIGLTGGIASGKSTVSQYLSGLGAVIIDADKIAREVVAPGQEAWHGIVTYFGKDILQADDTLDRIKLGNQIFADRNKKKALDELTHPQIKQKIMEKIATYKSAGNRIVVLDIPLLFEVGWNALADETWVVYVDREMQQKRLMERNQFSKEQAEKRMQSQMDLKEKAKLATFVIDNSYDLEYTKKQIIERWKMIRNLDG